MKITECCGHEFIGDNHSPIRPDGYCLHCGFHPEIQKLKEANKVLREAVIYALGDIDDSIAIDAQLFINTLAKADEIMGEKKC